MTEALDLTKDYTKENKDVDMSKTRKVQKKKAPRTGSAPYATVPLPPCKICGGNSTGYHFGAITCEACKAFFRRALIHKQEYKCSKNDNCEIILKRAGNCSACRLKKCYDLGMSKGGVRKGRYSIAIRTRAIVEAKASEGKSPAVTTTNQDVREMSKGNSSTSSLGYVSSPSKTNLLKNKDNVTSETSTNFTSSPSPDLDFKSNVELELLIDALVGCQDAVYPHLAQQFEKSKILLAQRQIFIHHFVVAMSSCYFPETISRLCDIELQ
ncbi:nuclear receptor ROR-beta-like [Ruditapes philippinarum]|uniref:nuclear receptor ROR-beta-like n=1 Tax=Ruditapes philippinarum TaxID=129788 RepID=UPI00295B0AC2|nr:nuclear receptor ROR-beta-like [Ruditapes philippinarum]